MLSDFGFVLGLAPGGKFSFEKPPFKLTREFVDVLDGRNSEVFR
jgi:phosphatidylinositol 4-kinase B